MDGSEYQQIEIQIAKLEAKLDALSDKVSRIEKNQTKLIMLSNTQQIILARYRAWGAALLFLGSLVAFLVVQWEHVLKLFRSDP